ncbi:MAG: hypothetical protein MAG451_00915 [Anaerolineales bacterium]|nr:hypothetical protein [Anaerolineales bacterium]
MLQARGELKVGHPGNDSPIFAHAGLLHYLASKTCADDALTHERLADLQFSSGLQHGHPGAGTGATGGAIYGAFTKDRSVAGAQRPIRLALGRPVELDGVNGVYERQLWMLHRKLVVGRVAQACTQVG